MSEHIQRHETDQGSRIVRGRTEDIAPHAKLQKASSISMNDDEAHVTVKEKRRSRSPSREKKVDTRSPEYILKSGLAGGLAGCAVRIPISTPQFLCCYCISHLAR